MLGRNGNIAYVRYDSHGRIVPGGPIISPYRPKVGFWQPVSLVTGNNVTSNALRAFVRLDAYGRVVPSSLLLLSKEPSNADSGTYWLEINAIYRPPFVPTTTTTTTIHGGVTPTAWLAYAALNPYSACQGVGGSSRVIYTSTSNIIVGAVFYNNAALTELYNSSLYGNEVAINGMIYFLGDTGGSIVIDASSCNPFTTTTTSTSTTIVPTTTSTTTTAVTLYPMGTVYYSSSFYNDFCINPTIYPSTSNIYCTTPTLQEGSYLYNGNSTSNPVIGGIYITNVVGQVFRSSYDTPGLLGPQICTYNFNLKSGPTQFNVCSGTINLNVYAASQTLSVGTQLYNNPSLTIPYSPGSPILVGFGNGVNDPVWQVNSTGQIISQFGVC